MTQLIVVIALIGSYTVTPYQSVPNQTDASPFTTSTGERTSPHGVAVSQDWLKKKILKYGDLVYIEDVGWRVVNDCMNERFTESFDVWVPNDRAERKFYRKFSKRKWRVWRIRGEIEWKQPS